jgi:hypothetical protein
MQIKHPVVVLVTSVAVFIVVTLLGSIAVYISEMGVNPAVKTVNDGLRMVMDMVRIGGASMVPMTSVGRFWLITVGLFDLVLVGTTALSIMVLIRGRKPILIIPAAETVIDEQTTIVATIDDAGDVATESITEVLITENTTNPERMVATLGDEDDDQD